MENNNINLLDLNNDILNIIGGYVKKDNERRIVKEKSFEFVDERMKQFETNARKNNRFINREETRFWSWRFFNCFYHSHFETDYIVDNNCEIIEFYKEYLILKNKFEK